MNYLRISIIVAAIAAVAAVVVAMNGNQTNAQMSTGQSAASANVNFTQLFNEKFHVDLLSLYVDVTYQSERTVVLEGEKLVGINPVENKLIWPAVDIVKQYGYKIDSVILTGQGSVGNPQNWEIVMSK